MSELLKKQQTTVILPEKADPIFVNRLVKRRRCCTFQRICLTVIIILVISCSSFQSLYLNHKTRQRYDRLLAKANISMVMQAKEVAELKDKWLSQLNAFDDASTATKKLDRMYRHLKDEQSNFQCSNEKSNKEKCKYSSGIAFFYTSHNTLEKSNKFRKVPVDRFRIGICREQYEETNTGQIWCNNSHPRDDSFINTFRRDHHLMTALADDPEVIYKFLTPASIMMKPGENWTNLSKHDFYNLLDRKEIIIKESGLYMIFSKAIFNISKGASITYSLRRNRGQKINKCELQPEKRTQSYYQQCSTFRVAYFNKDDIISVRIAAFTHFLIGEMNFYIGLYQIAPFVTTITNGTSQT